MLYMVRYAKMERNFLGTAEELREFLELEQERKDLKQTMFTSFARTNFLWSGKVNWAGKRTRKCAVSMWRSHVQKRIYIM